MFHNVSPYLGLPNVTKYFTVSAILQFKKKIPASYSFEINIIKFSIVYRGQASWCVLPANFETFHTCWYLSYLRPREYILSRCDPMFSFFLELISSLLSFPIPHPFFFNIFFSWNESILSNLYVLNNFFLNLLVASVIQVVVSHNTRTYVIFEKVCI